MKEEAMEQVLDGKVAIITGGGGGIGSVFGRELALRGASVVLADLNEDAATTRAADLAAKGLAVMGARLDATEPSSAAAVVDAAVRAYGGVDILVNCAALMAEIPFSPLSRFPLDWWDRVMAVNVKGPLVCAQAAVPAMRARGGGRIVSISSAGAFSRGGVYGVSKYALVSLTANLAAELGADGINVNAIAPGLVVDDAGYRALPDGQLRDQLRAIVPLKTHVEGPPEDLVGTLVLLVSDAGVWITGQTISVDGGWIMRL
ncbi:MAG TPA: SDR family oxidoreductase [Acidimicrobiales bacterium]|nr:SDR family oxidoreductase [Acidimicrobiales bacterium]